MAQIHRLHIYWGLREVRAVDSPCRSYGNSIARQEKRPDFYRAILVYYCPYLIFPDYGEQPEVSHLEWPPIPLGRITCVFCATPNFG